MSDEEPVLLPDGGRSDRVFDEVIVEPGEGLLLMGDQHVPVVQQIAARFAELRLGQRLFPQRGGEVAQPAQRTSKVFPAQLGPPLTDLRLIPRALQAVQTTDHPQDEVRRLRPFLHRIVKLAPGVRPAANAHDALGLAFMAGISAVLVRLQHAAEGAQERGEFIVTACFPEREHDVAPWATDHPEVTLPGLAPFVVGIVTPHRCFVGLEIAPSDQLPMQVPVDRVEPQRRHFHPIAHRLAADS